MKSKTAQWWNNIIITGMGTIVWGGLDPYIGHTQCLRTPTAPAAEMTLLLFCQILTKNYNFAHLLSCLDSSIGNFVLSIDDENDSGDKQHFKHITAWYWNTESKHLKMTHLSANPECSEAKNSFRGKNLSNHGRCISRVSLGSNKYGHIKLLPWPNSEQFSHWI